MPALGRQRPIIYERHAPKEAMRSPETLLLTIWTVERRARTFVPSVCAGYSDHVRGGYTSPTFKALAAVEIRPQALVRDLLL